MINDLNDFCTWMYSVADDIWHHIAPSSTRPGPAPECPDNALLAVAWIRKCHGWDVETETPSQGQESRDWFPVIPTQSRFPVLTARKGERCRRSCIQAINLILQAVFQCLGMAQDPPAESALHPWECQD